MISFLEQLPRKSLYILGLVAVAFLGSGYMTWFAVQEAEAKVSLEKQRDSASVTLQQLNRTTDLESLKAELAAAQSQLREVSFPERTSDVEFVALLVQASRETGLALGNFQVLVEEQEKVGNGNYRVTRLRLLGSASPPQATAFLGRLEKGGFPTLVVNNLSLAPKEGAWEIRLDIYLYSNS